MLRIGLHFDAIPATDQASLDRYIFQQMRKEARRKRHLRGALYHDEQKGAERRRARRVEIPADEELMLVLQSRDRDRSPAIDQLKALATPFGEEIAENHVFPVADISATGCSFFCQMTSLLHAQDHIHFRLLGADLDIEVSATVVYAIVVIVSSFHRS